MSVSDFFLQMQIQTKNDHHRSFLIKLKFRVDKNHWLPILGFSSLTELQIWIIWKSSWTTWRQGHCPTSSATTPSSRRCRSAPWRFLTLSPTPFVFVPALPGRPSPHQGPDPKLWRQEPAIPAPGLWQQSLIFFWKQPSLRFLPRYSSNSSEFLSRLDPPSSLWIPTLTLRVWDRVTRTLPQCFPAPLGRISPFLTHLGSFKHESFTESRQIRATSNRLNFWKDLTIRMQLSSILRSGWCGHYLPTMTFQDIFLKSVQ